MLYDSLKAFALVGCK